DGHTAAVRPGRERTRPRSRQRIERVPFLPPNVERFGARIQIRSADRFPGVRIDYRVQRGREAVVVAIVSGEIGDLGLAVDVRRFVANVVRQVAFDAEHRSRRLAVDSLVSDTEIDVVTRDIHAAAVRVRYRRGDV